MYKHGYFPKFVSGSGYLVSKKAAKCLLNISKSIPIIHLEDVYITGICAHFCKIPREHHKGFRAKRMKNGLQNYKIKVIRWSFIVSTFALPVSKHRFFSALDVIHQFTFFFWLHLWHTFCSFRPILTLLFIMLLVIWIN